MTLWASPLTLLDVMPPRPPDCLQVSPPVCTVIPLLCDRETHGYDAIVSLYLQKLLLQSHNVRYTVIEPFIHCRVSLEINNGQMESLDASDVKLHSIKVMPK